MKLRGLDPPGGDPSRGTCTPFHKAVLFSFSISDSLRSRFLYLLLNQQLTKCPRAVGDEETSLSAEARGGGSRQLRAVFPRPSRPSGGRHPCPCFRSRTLGLREAKPCPVSVLDAFSLPGLLPQKNGPCPERGGAGASHHLHSDLLPTCSHPDGPASAHTMLAASGPLLTSLSAIRVDSLS